MTSDCLSFALAEIDRNYLLTLPRWKRSCAKVVTWATANKGVSLSIIEGKGERTWEWGCIWVQFWLPFRLTMLSQGSSWLARKKHSLTAKWVPFYVLHFCHMTCQLCLMLCQKLDLVEYSINDTIENGRNEFWLNLEAHGQVWNFINR